MRKSIDCAEAPFEFSSELKRAQGVLRFFDRPVGRSITEKESQKAELEADLMGAKDLKKTKVPATLGQRVKNGCKGIDKSSPVRKSERWLLEIDVS